MHKLFASSIRKNFLLLSLGFAFLMTFFFFLLSSLSIKNATSLSRQYADNTLQKLSLSLSATLQNVQSAAYQLSHGQNIEHYLLPENDYELFTQHQALSSTANALVTSNSAISDIVLFRSDGRVPFHYSSDNTTAVSISNAYRTYFEQNKQTPSFQLLTVPEENLSCLVYVQPILYLSGQTSYWNQQLGCLLIFLNMKELSDLLSSSTDDLLNHLQLSDASGNVLLGDGLSSLEEAASLPIADTGLALSYHLNLKTQLQKYSFFTLLIPSVLFSFLLLYVLLLFIYNRSIVVPIMDLYHQICGIIEHDLKGRILLSKRGEISAIGDILNALLDHQERLSSELLETQKKFYESALKAKENELMILETQINSHFIINTLQCICGIAVSFNALPILEIADHMGKILQYSLRAPDKVTLRDELEIVTHYLGIIDIRYDNLFHWEIDVDESLYDQLLPKMTLQPLVENAVYHGLEKKGSGAIMLSASEENGQVILQIWDNGTGIEDSKLTELQTILADQDALYKASLVTKRIGLANSALRIKNLLGEKSGIRVESTPDAGTTVTIFLKRWDYIQSRNHTHETA